MINIPIENKVTPALELAVGGVQQSNSPGMGTKGVVLQKGQKVNLTKQGSILDEISVGLGWDVKEYGGIPYDLDASAFLLGVDGKVIGNEWFVFYNQPNTPDGNVSHSERQQNR